MHIFYMRIFTYKKCHTYFLFAFFSHTHKLGFRVGHSLELMHGLRLKFRLRLIDRFRNVLRLISWIISRLSLRHIFELKLTLGIKLRLRVKPGLKL